MTPFHVFLIGGKILCCEDEQTLSIGCANIPDTIAVLSILAESAWSLEKFASDGGRNKKGVQENSVFCFFFSVCYMY